MKCGGEVTVFLDSVRPGARLLLYGAGHVGDVLVAAGRVSALKGRILGLGAGEVDEVLPELGQALG